MAGAEKTVLKRICEEHREVKYHIEVIDLLVNPQLAKGDQILALPTLVASFPNLSHTERILLGLDVRTKR